MGERLGGTVARVVFRAPEGQFTVLRLEVPGRGLVTLVGPLGGVAVGESIEVEGVLERHPTHGEQFRVERIQVEAPRTVEGVQHYLEGLKGIGPELARRLVGAFGVAAVDLLEAEPWRAAQVKGVGKRRAAEASKEAAARKQDRELLIFLQGLGISATYAARIRKVYGSEAMQAVRENPYRLARDIPGIGFLHADRIARGLGIGFDSPIRIQAAILYALELFVDEGHVFTTPTELAERTRTIVETDIQIADALNQLWLSRALVLEGEQVYLPELYRAESELAERIGALIRAERRRLPGATNERWGLSAGQVEAVVAARELPVVVITGGPGTGKTTVIRTLVADWERIGARIVLAAPTGRAAKRLSEATGRMAQTVHRLLAWGGYGAGRDAGRFGRDRAAPLEADLIVIDEASMLDTLMAWSLFQAIPEGATVVLVGDVDQLPSVGPGQILADLIRSQVVRVVRLTEVFRQAEGSGIVKNAYRILHGEVPIGAIPAAERSDFYVVHAEEPERARDLVIRMCKERIPKAFGLDPVREVQVLSPMHRGGAGTEALNQALQEALNPTGRPFQSGGRSLRVGDKVMQLRNDYERSVFNGDLGLIVGVKEGEGSEGLEVDFDGRTVFYSADAVGQLELAYAVSVHKSQGSEYPAVVIPILMQHFLLLRRNLIYTAVTRGKRLVILVGSQRAIRRSVEQADAEQRHTGLRERLQTIGRGGG